MTIYTLMPLHQSLGLAVIGVDLSRPIDPETGENLSRLLAYSQHHVPGYPDIGLVRHQDGQRAAETWHTDHTNRERPPAATMLYGVEIPSSGGGTSIANMREAYWSLPEDERRRTVNGLDADRADTRAGDIAKYGAAVVHPMVRTHPVNRERAVYFHPTKTMYIEGMTPQASQDYLDDLVARIIQPEIVYRHAWEKGDVLVIDDRATLQRAHDDDEHGESRLLWRIIVEGDRPTLV
jgi:alpha-ketoglutarate-dependent taurine dioxygenase